MLQGCFEGLGMTVVVCRAVLASGLLPSYYEPRSSKTPELRNVRSLNLIEIL